MYSQWKRGVLRALWLLIALPLTTSALAATYYVDSSAGNDSNSGLAQNTAWRSVAGVNGAGLSAGDRVLFRRGQAFAGQLSISDDGALNNPITLGAWGSGAAPVLYEVLLRGDDLVLEDLTVDHQKDDGDALRIRGGQNIILRRMTLRNGTGDGIDADGADGLLIDTAQIHHFLAGSLGSEDDAHGVVVTNTNGVTIRGANIHHVSGDSFQADPNRSPGAIANNILIENSELWTGPLQSNFNAGWQAGDSPGENAIDTKVLKSGYESEPRMNITLRNVTAHGWQAGPAVSNRAAFNLKEKINATLDRITVYDCEIAFRVRGQLGNANTLIANAVIYDVETAVRAEDALTGLRLYNSTFGNGIGRMLQLAGGAIDTGTWDWRNNAFTSAVPPFAPTDSNLLASPADFVEPNADDYRLPASSSLVDSGVQIPTVTVDRDGGDRSAPYDVGAYERGGTSVPKPPILLDDT